MVAAKTNCGYIPIAFIFTEDETKVILKEALSILKSWNKNWNPVFCMSDFSLVEINSVKELFPHIKNHVCEFHRKQDIKRSLNRKKIICEEAEKEEFFKCLEMVAQSKYFTLQVALERVRSCNLYKKSEYVKNYIESFWFKYIHYWTKECVDGFQLSLNTNNGMECLNKELKSFVMQKSRHYQN